MALAFRVLEQDELARPEAARLTGSRRDLPLAGQDGPEQPGGGRMELVRTLRDIEGLA
jgi:hypothetical protein